MTLVESSQPNPRPYLGSRSVELTALSAPQATGNFNARAGSKTDIRSAIMPGAQQIVFCPDVIFGTPGFDQPLAFMFGAFLPRYPANHSARNFFGGAEWFAHFTGLIDNVTGGHHLGQQFAFRGNEDEAKWVRAWRSAADSAMAPYFPGGEGTPDNPTYDASTWDREGDPVFWTYNNWRNPGTTQQGTFHADRPWSGSDLLRGLPTHLVIGLTWSSSTPMAHAAQTTVQRLRCDVLSWGGAGNIGVGPGPESAIPKTRPVAGRRG